MFLVICTAFSTHPHFFLTLLILCSKAIGSDHLVWTVHKPPPVEKFYFQEF